MEDAQYRGILAGSIEPHALEDAAQYLKERLGSVLESQDRVLICVPGDKTGVLSRILEQAVTRCGALPLSVGGDYRWRTLLRQAFVRKASAIIGEPLVILGLAKLKRAYETPLFIRKAVTVGYNCPDWLKDGIRRGLDCRLDAIFGLGASGIIAGFSCDTPGTIHLREAVYGVKILDRSERTLPPGTAGEIFLYPKDAPWFCSPTGTAGRLETGVCGCGRSGARLLDLRDGLYADADILGLTRELHNWTSILDCRLERGPFGLEMELIVFPGEKLPKLPAVAKQIIRPLNPDRDTPFPFDPLSKNLRKREESH